jgi:hypothetical protein
MDEQVVAPGGVQLLDDSVPTLVTAASTERHDVAAATPACRCLHLDP